MNSFWFTLLVFVIGFGLDVGKVAVYKYIPECFPKDVGAVGGLVGLLGALGGFFLTPLVVTLYDWTWIPQSTFWLLFLLVAVSFAWLHFTVMNLLQQASPALLDCVDFQNTADKMATS